MWKVRSKRSRIPGLYGRKCGKFIGSLNFRLELKAAGAATTVASMGYSHHFRAPIWTTEDNEGYARGLPLIRDIIDRHRDVLDESEPIRADETGTQLNGGCESFVFVRGQSEKWSHVKTEGGLYDQAVCEVLLVLDAHCPGLEIESDGFISVEDGAEPKLGGSWPEAIEAVARYGLEYRVETVEVEDGPRARPVQIAQ